MSQQRIACTGDEAFGLEIRRLVLESFGYKARVLPDCAAATNALSRENYDLLILDYSDLTEVQTDCIRLLRAAHPLQRIMFIAPLPYTDERISTLVDCVLMKGATPEELRHAVQACIGTRQTQWMLTIARYLGASLGTARLLLKRRKKLAPANVTNMISKRPAPAATREQSARSAHP